MKPVAEEHRLVHLGCSAHCLRYFHDALQALPRDKRGPEQLTARFIELVRRLYRVYEALLPWRIEMDQQEEPWPQGRGSLNAYQSPSGHSHRCSLLLRSRRHTKLIVRKHRRNLLAFTSTRLNATSVKNPFQQVIFLEGLYASSFEYL